MKCKNFRMKIFIFQQASTFIYGFRENILSFFLSMYPYIDRKKICMQFDLLKSTALIL